jgi:hypothetical protein
MVVVVVVGLFSSRAEAQMSPELNQVLMNGAILKRSGIPAIAAAYDEKQGKPAAPKPGATRAPLTATDFKRVGPRLTATAFLKDATLTADQKAVFEQAVDLMFTGVAKELRKDNLATAMGFALAAALEVSSGKEVPTDEVKQIIANVNDNLVASPQVKAMTDAQKADLHDRMIISTGFMAAFSMMKDPGMKALGQKLAKDFLAQLK